MRFFWGCHSWFLRYVWFIFQYWYFIMETSSIHNVKPVVPFKALIGYFRPQQVLCSCCPQPRWCFPKMSNKQTLDVAHCRRDPSCGGPPDRCSQSTIPVTLLPSLTISFSRLLIGWSRNRRVSDCLETVVNVDYDIYVDIVVLLLLM